MNYKTPVVRCKMQRAKYKSQNTLPRFAFFNSHSALCFAPKGLPR